MEDKNWQQQITLHSTTTCIHIPVSNQGTATKEGCVEVVRLKGLPSVLWFSFNKQSEYSRKAPKEAISRLICLSGDKLKISKNYNIEHKNLKIHVLFYIIFVS